METEFFTLFTRKGARQNPDEPLEQMLTFARKQPHLAALHGGLFLANGARLYRDHGDHLELATPEVSSPVDAVRYQRAGEQMLQALSAELAEKTGVHCLLASINVDYGKSTWGFHENYLTRHPVLYFQQALLPFLVTRLLYSGAGGLTPRHRHIAFHLSPRTKYLTCEASSDSTGGRPIFHWKDESLCEKYCRLHLLCGNALSSDTGLYLTIGATALIVHLLDTLKEANTFRLLNPLQALRNVASDLTCRLSLETSLGPMTALAIQRRFLHLAQNHRDSLPSWASSVLKLWKDTLDHLEAEGYESLSRVLDWPLKYVLFQDICRERHGVPWEDLSALSLRDPVARAIRSDLIEADIRFSQPGEGLFAQMDQGGHLRHKIPGVSPSSIRKALSTPPTDTRAAIRGHLVRQYAQVDDGRWLRLDWNRLDDLEKDSYIPLPDPFAVQLASEAWIPRRMGGEEHPTEPADLTLRGQADWWHSRGKEADSSGDYVEAGRCFERAQVLAESDGWVSMDTHCRWHRADIHQRNSSHYEEIVLLIQPILERFPDGSIDSDRIHFLACAKIQFEIGPHIGMSLAEVEALHDMTAAVRAQHPSCPNNIISAVETAYATALEEIQKLRAG